MAPIDRKERRAQRMRGAGANSVQANFGFTFGSALAPLQPQRSSRRTPQSSAAAKRSSVPPPSSSKTPDAASRLINSSSKRQRSASLQHSSGRKLLNTVREFVTPQLGKRKRNAQHATPVGEDDGEADHLSPENDDETVRSIEKSRRVVATRSPTRDEETDDAPDELSYVDAETMVGSVQRVQMELFEANPETPLLHVVKPRASDNAKMAVKRTPVTNIANANAPAFSKSTVKTTAQLRTPVLPPSGRSQEQRITPASRLSQSFEPNDFEGSEDELSPPQPSIGVPRLVSMSRQTPVVEQEEDVDELSPQAQPTPFLPKLGPSTSSLLSSLLRSEEDAAQSRKPRIQTKEASWRRARPIVEEDEDEDEEPVRSTPRLDNPSTAQRRTPNKSVIPVQAFEEDELSPEADRRMPPPSEAATKMNVPEVHRPTPASIEEDEVYESDEDENRELTPRPVPTSKARTMPNIVAWGRPHDRMPSDLPPKKKQRKEGPSEAIGIMRLKGFAHKGLTAVDTAKHLVGKLLQQNLERLVALKSNADEPERARGAKRSINHILIYKDNVEEHMLELQDANSALKVLDSKNKQYKRENRILRQEYIDIQKQRDEVAFQADELLYLYEEKKKAIDERNELSNSIFEIQAAVENGKEKALAEGRENEGPEVPLKMLLETVARDVGGSSGILGRIRNFNGILESAAGLVEGRA